MSLEGAKNRIYRGMARNGVHEGGSQVVTVTDQHETTTPLRHRVRHSPDGFQWGYGGSGPADLARSILWDHLGNEPSPSLYQDFKWDVIAALPIGENFTITSKQVQDWLDLCGWTL